jgi:hypothetical protein
MKINPTFHFLARIPLFILVAHSAILAGTIIDCCTFKKVPDVVRQYIQSKHPGFWIPTVGQYRKFGNCVVDTNLIGKHRECNPSCIEIDLNRDGKKDFVVNVLYDDSIFNRNLEFIVLISKKNGKLDEMFRRYLSGGSDIYNLQQDSLNIRLGYLAPCKFKRYHHSSEADTSYEIRAIPTNGFITYGDCGSNAFYLKNDSLIEERFTDCY